MKITVAVAGVALAAALAVTPSGAVPMQPGLWEVLTRADPAAAPGTNPPISRVCFTEQDVVKTGKTLPVPSQSCQSLNPVTGKDGTTSYDIVCTGSPSMRGKASMATTATAYEGSMKLALRIAPDKPDTPINFTFAGRRVGDCPAASK